MASSSPATDAHVTEGGKRPSLAVVLVGSDPASRIYVQAKRRDGEKAGILTRDFDLPESTSQEELLALIDELNRDDDIHGILVQLPLPPQIDEIAVTNSIKSSKDVDGFHAFNVGRLALRQHGLRPCTPLRDSRRLQYCRPADGAGNADPGGNRNHLSPFYKGSGEVCAPGGNSGGRRR